MLDLGIVKPGSTIRIPFPTFTSDDPQASATVTAFVAADIEIYKDGSTTQRASDAGYTVTVDFDTTTGVQLVAVDLADNTTAGFYASGSEYFIIAGPFTLDAATINIPIARFIIGMQDADLNTTIATLASQTSFTLTKGPAENDALNGCVMYAHDVASEVQGGYAVVSDYTGSTKTVTLTAGPTFTMAATDNVHFYPPTNVNSWNAVNLATTNPLPNAAADAAGGLPISDAGGLDLDTQLAATNEVTAARMGALTDWINGGRLDLLLDAIKVVTDTQTAITPAALVDLVWDEVLTGATHNVAQSAGRRLRAIQEFQGYEGGQVWIDTVGGTAGTTDFENGTVELPVLTLADAVTIGASIGLDRFKVSNASSITFASGHANEVWSGDGWTLALGGQDVSETHIYHCNDVSGTGSCPTGEVHIIDSHVATSVACTLGQAHLTRCTFGAGGLVLSQATDYMIDDCSSGIPGAAAPTIDMGAAVGATNMSVRKWSGGITLNNLASGDVVTLEGIFGTVTLNGADASVEIRGIAKAVTNNLTGSPTVNDDTLKTDIQEDWTDGGRLDLILDELTTQGDTNEAAIGALNDLSAAQVNAECDTAISDAALATAAALTTVDTVVDAIKAVTDLLPDSGALSSLSTAAALATVDSNVDAILVDTASIGITKNAVFSNLEFLMVDETDHITPETGLTVTGQMSIDGAAFASVNGTIAEVSNGIYQVDLTADDTNGDVITYRFSATGAADRFITIKTRA